MRDIDKYTKDYKASLQENENVFLSKVKKRQEKGRKVLHEI